MIEKSEYFKKDIDCKVIREISLSENIWFLNSGEFFYRSDKTLNIEYKYSSNPVYLIYGNKRIKQEQTSKNLIDISGISKLLLNFSLEYKDDLQVEVFVQFYTEEFLFESSKYMVDSGNNILDFKELHPTITHLKLMFRFMSKEVKSSSIISFKSIGICIEKFRDKEKSDISNKTVKQDKLPNIRHQIITDKNSFVEGEKTYEINVDNTLLYFYLHYIPGQKLIVALPGATDRSKSFYNFQRYSWAKNLDYSFMSFLDPTIQETNDLSIGWFQGTSDNYALPKLVTLLKNLFTQNNIDEKDVVFFGSSAGGFTSLKIANDFPNSKIIVINPQIYVYNYVKGIYESFIAYTYPDHTKKEILQTFGNRLTVEIEFSKRNAEIYYYQNIGDTHHMVRHLKPYLETLDTNVFQIIHNNDSILKNKKLYIFKYDDPEGGHSPPNKEKTLKIIGDIVDNRMNKGQK